MLCECSPFAPSFDCSWSLSSYYPLERVCPSVLRSPSSRFAYSYAPLWCSLCPSALVHSYHMVSPFPLETAAATVSFTLILCLTSALVTPSLHTNFSILRSIFRWQVWTIICSFPWSDRVWAPYNKTGNSPGFHDGYFVSRFWNLSAIINCKLLNLFQAIPILLLIYFPELLRNGISCPRYVCSGTYSGASPFSLIPVSALFVITLVCFVLIC